MIRLKKLVCSTLIWPRLLTQSDRLNWISNDFDAMKIEADNPQAMINRNDDAYDSSDSDENDFLYSEARIGLNAFDEY